MENSKNYQKLLIKMRLVESAGEIFYKTLASKTKDNNLKLSYEKLALNEYETLKLIEKEILTINRNRRTLIRGARLSLAKIICSMLTAKQLEWILKTILKRRMYSKWYNMYKDKNQDFWYSLLNHENLQYRLLRPLFEN